MIVLYLLIGLFAGLASGLFGVGGGVLIVPALTFLAKFSQEKATGTSLAVLLPPVGLMAVIEYYRQGEVDLKAGLIIALGLVLGAWGGALFAPKMGDVWLKITFGVFVISVGFWIVVNAVKGIHLKGI